MKANLARATAIGVCAGLAACQPGVGGSSAQPSPVRLEYVSQFKKIDAAGTGRITMEQATKHYSALFRELDKNGDGFLDVNELEPLIPVMGARSGRELLFALDRNSDNRISQSELLVIANWLFQLASSRNEMILADAERVR